MGQSSPSRHPPRPPSPGRPTLQSLLPRGFSFLRLRSRSLAQVRATPARTLNLHPAAHLPPRPRVRGSHLGAGAGPAHRPEQQEREGERAGGTGHGGALRTGPSLPPAAPRSATGPGRAAAPGEEPARGPPRPREGRAGSRVFRPGRRRRLWARPGPGGTGRCAPGERRLGLESAGARPPAASAAPTPARQPSPGLPQPGKPSHPHLFGVPQRKLRPVERRGLVQGHTAPQTPPGKCSPKKYRPSTTPLLIPGLCP